jgi:hypothetical protein
MTAEAWAWTFFASAPGLGLIVGTLAMMIADRRRGR